MTPCPKCGWPLTWLKGQRHWCGDCRWTGSEVDRVAAQSTPGRCGRVIAYFYIAPMLCGRQLPCIRHSPLSPSATTPTEPASPLPQSNRQEPT